MADQMCGHWYLQACGLVNNDEDDVSFNKYIVKFRGYLLNANKIKYLTSFLLVSSIHYINFRIITKIIYLT